MIKLLKRQLTFNFKEWLFKTEKLSIVFYGIITVGKEALDFCDNFSQDFGSVNSNYSCTSSV